MSHSSINAAPSPRHKAGADPAKRDQILAGAKAVFMKAGFDAASVNDICREAGVSKSTLYVYFENKEELFESMVEAERDRLFEGISTLLTQPRPAGEILFDYGTALVPILCSDPVIKAQRIVIGIAERMPELGARFYAGGATRAQRDVAAFLQRKQDEGELAVPDLPLAAAQFIDLATANLWKPRLFGRDRHPPTATAVEAAVRDAVRIFLAAYRS